MWTKEKRRSPLFTNLHWTEGADIAALVRQVWRAPVMLIQEQRALALGHPFRLIPLGKISCSSISVTAWWRGETTGKL